MTTREPIAAPRRRASKRSRERVERMLAAARALIAEQAAATPCG